MDKLIKTDKAVQPTEEPLEIVYGEILDVKKGKLSVDVKGVLNKMCQLLDFSEIINSISAETQYMVVIPEEFRKGLKNGDNWLMRNAKNSDLHWPNIMQKTANGKSEIAKPLGIKEVTSIVGDPVTQLSQKFQDMYLQGQIQQVTELLEETLEEVKKIQQGQELDRIGLLNSGKEMLYLAMNQKNDETREAVMLNAISNISIAKNQILEVFKERVKDFGVVPESKLMQYIKVFFSARSDYLSKKQIEYDKLKIYFKYISEATKLMSTGYLLIGDEDNAKRVYDIMLSEISRIELSGLQSAKYIPEIICDLDNIKEQLNNDKKLCLEQANSSKPLAIEISGKMLLEAYSNEQ